MQKKESIVKSFDDDSSYDSLIFSIGEVLQHGRERAVRAVNSTMVRTYWEIGKQIIEYEQMGNEKAEYGSQLLKRLSRDLTIRFGKGFGMSNVNKMRKLYICYPILQTLSAKLSWSHYIELLMLEDPLERSFYEKECIDQHYQITPIALSVEKKGVDAAHRVSLFQSVTVSVTIIVEGSN